MENNRIIPLFENNEISYEIVPCEEKALEKTGYKKLPNNAFERISMSLQNVPGQVAMKVTEKAANRAAEDLAKNAYKVVLKDGIHLAKSKTLNGAYKGLAFLDSNNKLSTHADWVPISLDGSIVAQAPQIVLGVFNAMSIATGQYFLSQINGKLSAIEEGVSGIMGYLETEKRSEIIANDVAIMEVYKNLEFIMNSEVARQSTSIELKTIKNKSLSNILLFRTKIEATSNKLKSIQKGKLEDLEDAERDLLKDIPQYWFAVRSYANASFLYAVVADLDDPDYLGRIKADLEEKVNQFRMDCDSSDRNIKKFIETAHELNKGKTIPGIVNSIADLIPVWNGITAGIKLVGKVAVEVDSRIVENSKKKKRKAEELEEEFWRSCKNVDPLEKSVDLIKEFRDARNTPLEIICSEDAAYIKYTN